MRVCIKLGGSILEDDGMRMRLLEQVARLADRGNEIIIVHGGGKSLNRRLAQLQIASSFKEGLRVTDAETLAVAVMVLTGEVNKKIVVEMNRIGKKAIGLCGADAAAVLCVPLANCPGAPEGIGFVGKPVAVNKSFFDMVIAAGLIPVVSSIAMDAAFQLYNINADQMAASCAAGNGCSSLVYLTDVPGVRDKNGSVISFLGKTAIAELIKNGTVTGGMLPKTASCLEALDSGVSSVHILPGFGQNILDRFADGTLAEGTTIHGNQ
ncbi:MAG TPA: acetylglutamate kinase [Acidobacteriota bacterium]|nr:acetylglutamate kinase [Acidobacteriota bacterium]